MSDGSTVTTTVDLFEGAVWNDPYPVYAGLRDTNPVCRVQTNDGPVWMMFRHADVRAALADPRLSKDWRCMLPPRRARGSRPPRSR